MGMGLLITCVDGVDAPAAHLSGLKVWMGLLLIYAGMKVGTGLQFTCVGMKMGMVLLFTCVGVKIGMGLLLPVLV
jgi:hypothetical protein